MIIKLRNSLLKLLVALLAILVLIAGALVFAPNQAALFISKPLLASSDIALTELEGLKIGFTELSFSRMIIVSNNDSVTLTGGRIGYHLTDLINQKLGHIVIERALVQTGEPVPSAPSSQASLEPQSLNELLTQSKALPFEQLEINSAQLLMGQLNLDAAVSLSTQPLILNFNVREPNQTVNLSGALSQISETSLAGMLVVADNDEDILTSEIDIIIDEEGLQFTALNNTQPQKLASYMNRFAGLQGLSSSAEPSVFTLQLSYMKADTDTVDFNINFAGQPPTIIFDQPMPDVEVDVAIALPSSVAGNYEISSQHLELALNDFSGALKASLAETTVTAELSFKQNGASCSSLFQCEIKTSIFAISSVDAGLEGIIEGFSAGTSITASWFSPVFTLSSDSLALSIPAIISSDLQGEAALTFTNISIAQDTDDQTFTAAASYLIDKIKVNNNTLEINDMSLSGDFDIKDNHLKVTASLVLANQLTATALVEHNLTNGQGYADFVLDDYSFSQITPLSKLVKLKSYNIELIAGILSGHSEIRWQQASDGKLKIAGPIDFKLNDLSGYYDELFFVGLTTAVSAELLEAWSFRSSALQRGKIATFDSGIPTNDIRWDYAWEYSLKTDNEYSLLSISDLTAAILGGEVSIPRIDFDSNKPQSDANIVISKLSLETIVGLADYPGLRVDGYISGYLPISLTDSGVTLDNGLISALNPGGTINYLPATPAPASNPGLKLVNDALSNYQYNRLNTDVVYAKTGDLTLAVQLQGFNPDMNQGQAINLNVNVADNIPSLLKSLQASRSISDALEESLNNKQQK